LVVVSLEIAGSLYGNEPPAASAARQSRAGKAYLKMLENFAGFAEQHWNDKENCYDAAGSGVTWARGNGDVCLVNAVLLTEFPDRKTYSPRNIPREVMLDHVRRTIRTVCLNSNVCTDPRAIKPGRWGGPDPRRGGWHWQAGLETVCWTIAAHLLADQLDDDTLALVRQVATAEADGAAERKIRSARPGDTAADDCGWNAEVLGVCAAIYADDPRASKWDEWAKRWALNTEARETDHNSKRMIDGRPLGEWLVSTQAYPDLTVENHDFWNLPYQTSFAEMIVPIVAYKMCGRPIPEAFHANALEEGDQILKWLVMPDGDLLCPQGIDWAERDVQHSWAYVLLGTLLDQAWARAAEARCIDLLTRRQALFNDGSIHALDFGYETDLARMWTYSYLLHKYFGKGDSGSEFDEPRGARIFPYVKAAVFRTPDLVSSVTWFRSRQAVMVSPNNLKALADRPAFTRYNQESGTGWIDFQGESKRRSFKVQGEPQIAQDGGALAVSFAREIPDLAQQEIAYAALPTGSVVVFSRWQALGDIEVAELIDHPFRWVEIEKFISKPPVKEQSPEVWNIDDKLEIRIFAEEQVSGELAVDGIDGLVRRDFVAKAGDVLLDSVCVYQPVVDGRTPATATRDADSVKVGDWRVRREKSGELSLQH
jgi:hypothetical protein